MLRRFSPACARLLFVALLGLAAPAALAAGRLIRLAGVQPVADWTRARWPWCGAWIYPVGNRDQGPGPRELGYGHGFIVLRGISAGGAVRGHQGADIGDGRNGDTVRAAAHGLVVLAVQRDTVAEYGSRIVLAHRLPDGTLLYSVYAHLVPGSVRVRAGQRVWCGQAIGRVGHSGNATAPHLHFEVREPADPEQRWENTEPLDPLAFVDSARAITRALPPSQGRYLRWAEESALIRGDEDGAAAITRGQWWRMLGYGARHALEGLPESPEALRAALVGVNVLPRDASARADEPPTPDEIARDIHRLAKNGVRTPPPPIAGWRHRALCVQMFGVKRPSAAFHPVSAKRTLALGEACVLIADLTAPPEPRKASPKHGANSIAKAP